MTRTQRHNGFTLIELLAAVAVLAILVGIGSRLFGSGVDATRAHQAGTALWHSLTLAQAQATSGDVDVVMCPSRDGRRCADDEHWESGWIVFADVHNGGQRDTDEPIYYAQAALPPRVHLVSSAGRTRLRFQPSGSNGFSNATFTLCDGRGAAKATAVVLSNEGRLHTATPNAERVAVACAG